MSPAVQCTWLSPHLLLPHKLVPPLISEQRVAHNEDGYRHVDDGNHVHCLAANHPGRAGEAGRWIGRQAGRGGRQVGREAGRQGRQAGR